VTTVAANGWTFDRLGRPRRMGCSERELQRMGVAVVGAGLRARDFDCILRRVLREKAYRVLAYGVQQRSPRNPEGA